MVKMKKRRDTEKLKFLRKQKRILNSEKFINVSKLQLSEKQWP